MRSVFSGRLIIHGNKSFFNPRYNAPFEVTDAGGVEKCLNLSVLMGT